MDIQDYFQIQDSRLSFTREQASLFAKNVAGDFNPIHDPDSKRFCVPGDLLFSVIIHHYGLRQRMVFNFSGMVGDQSRLILPDCNAEQLAVMDENEKKYLTLECRGEINTDKQLIESLTTKYVEFSGKAFPHILVPLMQEQNVMINADRPLVIYESMSFEFDTMDITDIDLQLSDQTLNVQGKRGDVTLSYELISQNQVIGKGCKRMVLSGLRDYDEEKMDLLVKEYDSRKSNFTAYPQAI